MTAPATRPSLWRHADFRRLWAGDTASQLGFSLGSLALPYLAVTTLRATQFEMGLLAALTGLGFLLIGLPAGAIVDRHRKRRIMIGADLGRGLLLLTLPAAGWLHLLGLPQVLVVATAIGMLTVFFDVSYQSYLPELVEAEDIVEGNAKLQASQSVSQAAGPAVGGAAITHLGTSLVLTVNAAGYLVSAWWLSRIRRPEPPAAPRPARMIADIREGLAFILTHRLLRRLVACTGLANLTASITNALTVFYFVRRLGLSAFQIGLIESLSAVGGLAGALLTGVLTRRTGQGAAITVTAVTFTGFAFAMPLAAVLPTIPTLIVGGIGLNAAVVAYNVATVSFRQRLCPPRLLGRMNASARFLVWGTMPIGGLLGGVLGSWLGTVATLWVAAAGGLLALIPVLTPTLWRLRELPGPGPEGSESGISEPAISELAISESAISGAASTTTVIAGAAIPTSMMTEVPNQEAPDADASNQEASSACVDDDDRGG